MFGVGKSFSHLFFLAIRPCLPAAIFRQKFSSARNQMLFIDQDSAVFNKFFSTYRAVFLKLRYRHMVAFPTKN